MTITKQIIEGVSAALNGKKGFLCLDFKPDKKCGLGGEFVDPPAEDWTCLPGCLPFYWPTGKFRYFKQTITIGPRRGKQDIVVLVTDAINVADLRELQRRYVTYTALQRAK